MFGRGCAKKYLCRRSEPNNVKPYPGRQRIVQLTTAHSRIHIVAQIYGFAVDFGSRLSARLSQTLLLCVQQRTYTS